MRCRRNFATGTAINSRVRNGKFFEPAWANKLRNDKDRSGEHDGSRWPRYVTYAIHNKELRCQSCGGLLDYHWWDSPASDGHHNTSSDCKDFIFPESAPTPEWYK